MEVVAYADSARVLRSGFSPEPIGGKVGLLTAGTSDVRVAEEARMGMMVGVAVGWALADQLEDQGSEPTKED